MISIDDEIQHLIQFLSHPCGFEVGLYAILEIRPIDESAAPSDWEVSWTEMADGVEYNYFKEFVSLEEAARFFVEKRRYLCLGADFEETLMGETVEVEIE